MITRSSLRAALASIKDKAKKLSSSSSASAKDDATLVGDKEEFEKMSTKEVEDDTRRA
jgi:hypothetical protein